MVGESHFGVGALNFDVIESPLAPHAAFVAAFLRSAAQTGKVASRTLDLKAKKRNKNLKRIMVRDGICGGIRKWAKKWL